MCRCCPLLATLCVCSLAYLPAFVYCRPHHPEQAPSIPASYSPKAKAKANTLVTLATKETFSLPSHPHHLSPGALSPGSCPLLTL